jgi:protoporphyrinogen oxidase
MSEQGIVILGAGMAGLGAAHRLAGEGVSPIIYEMRPAPGGHTSTHVYPDGFTFDEGPHISFTDDERIKDLFARAVDGQFERLKAFVNNYWRGRWIKHPAQVNLYDLPPELVADCIADFVDAAHQQNRKIETYEDWLRASFGDTFAETFPMEYTLKYHTTAARNLTTDWLGPRLYRPSLKEVLKGALEPEPLDVHYVDNFRYPTHGGFASYLSPLIDAADIRCRHAVRAIQMREKRLIFTDGRGVPFERLISSIPLPKLIPMIEEAPKEVRDAAHLLSCSQAVIVNIGLNRPVDTRAQWTYFYDSDICFARASFPSVFSPNLTPPGCGSIQAEIYFSDKWKPLQGAPQDWIEPTIDGLIHCGLVRDRAEIVHKSVIFAPFANVIFDYDRPKALETVHGFLDEIGIAYCGRYGDWGYIWTDQAFKSGERAANMILNRAALRAV